MLFGEPKPVLGKAQCIIHAPLEPLFTLMGENFMENYQKWSPEVKELKLLTPGPFGEGSLVRQVRVDRGHKSESSFRVIELDEKGSLAFNEVDDRYRCAYRLVTCSDDPQKTVVDFSFEFPELEKFLRPFEKLVRIAVQEGATQNLQNLKRFAEGTLRS